ncbi:MAG: hypothetical protein LQ347_004379 [Umbilicaria vellea]|nr:MAG: hypothetical protein LQ347_004379 [Umbilicaria vellea]
MSTAFKDTYPWVIEPMIACGPMRMIALSPLAVAVSRAGGIGFLAAGSDLSDLQDHLEEAARLINHTPVPGAGHDTLPIGVGFLNWGADLDQALEAIRKYVPAAVWFFAPRKNEDLALWTERIREVSAAKTKIWIQVGTVADAIEIARLSKPDVLVVQGIDAGGHGLERGAGIITLLPEVADALQEQGLGHIALVAAGGVVEGRGTAACLALGAAGVVMGTRFLACTEAQIAKGYQDEVIRAKDGGVNTVRSRVYDILRGTTDWPGQYNGRGIINQSFLDATNGEVTEENKTLYMEAMKLGNNGWGLQGRMTTYAGTGVGLVHDIKTAETILEEVRTDAERIQQRLHKPKAQL